MIVVENWVKRFNELGSSQVPFLFILDFELLHPLIYPLSNVQENILFKINDVKNYFIKGKQSKNLHLNKIPISFEQYCHSFDGVMKELNYGNTFLINLTFPTEIITNFSLKELFNASHAKYKLYFEDTFIVSSPETFIRISDNVIRTFPMKGTIDAGINNAKEIILNDPKETAEHYTIVDLLRNDISMVAEKVTVNRFRYIDEIKTNTKTLYQVSSEISGKLEHDYYKRLGDIFAAILPAGSISGAPKKKTGEIINTYEIEPRGYYTGIFGIFDGKNVDTGVMIRYIEKKGDKLFYRSGCGITNMSDAMSEYQEMLDKVYVPISRNY